MNDGIDRRLDWERFRDMGIAHQEALAQKDAVIAGLRDEVTRYRRLLEEERSWRVEHAGGMCVYSSALAEQMAATESVDQ